MSEEAVSPQPETSPKESPGELDRLLGVLFDPKATFPDIAARPHNWWMPLLLLALLGVSFTYAYTQRVGWESFMREQIEQSPRAQNLSAEEKEQAIELQARIAPIFGYASGVLGWPVFVLVMSGVFLFVLNVLLGAQLTLKPVFTVTAYSMLPNFVGGIVAMVVLFLKRPADFNLQNPVASNVGAFLDPNTVPTGLVSFASSIDIFAIWALLLLATGYSAAARKLAWGKVFTWVVAVWVVYVVVKSGLAQLFG
jgi:hypothetical protein